MSDRNPGSTRGSLVRATHDFVFRRVHGSQLIYNCAWEDPRIDRKLLQIDNRSRVVMITSAGCNVLDYLLDDPQQIHAVDMNYRQNAVLELKMAMLRAGELQGLFECFGLGASLSHRKTYGSLRRTLPDSARLFWDDKIRYFDPKSLRRSFYFHGGSGTAAWLARKALFAGRPNLADLATCLLEAETLEEQADIYRELEPAVWGGFARWLVRQPAMMTLLGVPRPQMQIIANQYPGGLGCFVRDKLRRVLTEVPIADNYFWRVYLTGRYSRDCCPSYLQPEHADGLAQRLDRVQCHTSTVSQFLRKHPGQYSHYVLLDHQDWLAAHDPVALREEWELILANSQPGTRILMRSAGLSVGFIPADILERLRFQPLRTATLHGQDRVGTYGSLHFAEVR